MIEKKTEKLELYLKVEPTHRIMKKYDFRF